MQSLVYHDVRALFVIGLFKRLAKKTGIQATAHLLRHSHATELIRSGWDMAYVQKRLGHSSIQTTINTYVHLTEDDWQAEYQKNLKQRDTNNEISAKFKTAFRSKSTITKSHSEPIR